MRSVSIALAALLATWAPQAAAQDRPEGWHLELSSAHHADALPLSALGSDDTAARALAPRTGRNLAYVEDLALLARRQGAWTVGALARSSATLSASADALDLAGTLARGDGLDHPRSWAVDARFAAFTGAGVLLQRHFQPAAGWQLALSSQWLQLRRWRDRSLAGEASRDAAQGSTWAFDLVSTRHDDKLRFPFQQSVPGSGQGLLLGAQAQWRQGPWQAMLAADDAGWLAWRRLPGERALLSTRTQATDADGFVVIKPLVQGRNLQDSQARWQRPRWAATLQWQADAGTTLQAGLRTRAGFGALPELGVQRQLGAHRLGLGWRLHERQLSLAWGWQGWQLQAGSDRLGAGARSRSWSMAYAVGL